MADTNWWWNLGTSLCSWEQKTVYGILPQRIISAQELQNQKPCWKRHIDCILRLWRCCAHWLPGKRCYSELRTLQWNPYYIKEREREREREEHHEEGGRNWWHLASTWQCQASHKCCHNWYHCKFWIYCATTSSLQPGSHSWQFPLVPQTQMDNTRVYNFSSDEVKAAVHQ